MVHKSQGMRVTKEDLKLRRQDDKTYSELLYESKDASQKVAKVYIPQLCWAKRREDYPNIDLEKSPVERVKKMCDNIKAQVIHDCTWWSYDTIRVRWPEWIKDEYYVDLAKAQDEKRRQKLAITMLAQEQESASEGKRELNLLSSVMHDIKLPKIRPEPEPEESATPVSGDTYTGGNFTGPTPIELYEDTVQALEKVWIPLTGQDALHAHGMDDVFLHHIKPTKNVRIKLMKGLDESRRIHLRNCAVYVKAVLEDVIKLDEETAVRKEVNN